MQVTNRNSMIAYPSASTVCRLCLIKYYAFPKTGRILHNKEWTVVAGVVLHDSNTSSNKVVSIGVGTKSLSGDKVCAMGLIVHDSHAEVLARRALLRYTYNELKKAMDNNVNDSIFKWNQNEKKFVLGINFSFHYVTTQTPCGDACIIEGSLDKDDDGEPSCKKAKFDHKNEDKRCNKNNTLYTGAKLLGAKYTDAMKQILGAVRTKPGRGGRTLSVSCTDKIAKWNILGWQGALLFALLKEPIYFSTLNFCCNSNTQTLKRSLISRWQKMQHPSSKFQTQHPEIRVCNEIIFEHHKDSAKTPSPSGLAWCAIAENLRPFEASANGKRIGSTNQVIYTSQKTLKISRIGLLQEFIGILKMQPALLKEYKLKIENLSQMTYYEYKQLGKPYQKAWLRLKNQIEWTEKPKHLQDFTLELHEEMIASITTKKFQKQSVHYAVVPSIGVNEMS